MKHYTWVNIQELFLALNKECNYLILRNYEEINEDKFLMEAHPDIDLLCDNPRKLKKILKNVPNPGHMRHKDHYWAKVGSRMIEVGIRSVGDCYYDTKWAQSMLDTRMLHAGGFYVMNADNYFYSLIYHAAFQKKKFSEDYRARLSDMADNMGMEAYAGTEEAFQSLLSRYMRKKGYFVTCPKDITVPMQFDKIPDDLLQGKEAWHRRKILHIPERAVRFIFRRLLKT